ncbi:MAG: FHA domain-containing protein [Prevotellaceae bacterium]|jgi:hypothetical protein|nr:FHA domain-containing protein [Prevotellaceae bacterium]
MKVITIGRNSGNNVVINDSLVSKNHCQIIRDDYGNFSLVDNNSTNGTFVNGQRRHGQIRLNSSDIIRIGNTTLPWMSYFSDSTIGGNATIVGVSSGGGYTPPPKSSNMGIAALCCGIVGLFFAGIILGLLAIIFGAVGMSRQEKNKGLSITGLILGIIDFVLAVIILVALGTLGYFG